MTADEVLAVVVSYNGGESTRTGVVALHSQVGRVLVVDNGSNAESLAVLDSLERELGVVVERLGANRGVGHALNIGVQRARAEHFKWLLTMDQDSVAGPDLVPAYVAAINQDPSRRCLAPAIASRPATGAAEGRVAYAITSGNLVRVDLFDLTGPYDEGFFIDCIDFDFSLRVRRAGHAIHRVPGATMRHHVGEAVTLRVPRIIQRFYNRHAPARRYYMYRNYLYMVERYLIDFPAFILKLTLAQVLLTVLIAVLDPHPVDSYRLVARGIRHYLARKTGPIVEPA